MFEFIVKRALPPLDNICNHTLVNEKVPLSVIEKLPKAYLIANIDFYKIENGGRSKITYEEYVTYNILEQQEEEIQEVEKKRGRPKVKIA